LPVNPEAILLYWPSRLDPSQKGIELFRFHRFSPEIRERNLKRIMRETRKIHNVELMIEKYLAAYEQLNGGIPLA
jgi:hypothetical protein